MRAISVRLATSGDVPGMSVTLTRSITELCTADHRGDPTFQDGQGGVGFIAPPP